MAVTFLDNLMNCLQCAGRTPRSTHMQQPAVNAPQQACVSSRQRLLLMLDGGSSNQRLHIASQLQQQLNQLRQIRWQGQQ